MIAVQIADVIDKKRIAMGANYLIFRPIFGRILPNLVADFIIFSPSIMRATGMRSQNHIYMYIYAYILSIKNTKKGIFCLQIVQ